MKILIIIIGALIVVTSIEVMRLMPKSDRSAIYGLFSLRVIKFVTSAVSGMMLSYYAFKGHYAVWHAVGGLALLLFPVAEIFNRTMYDLSITNPSLFDKLNKLFNLAHRRATDDHT